MNAIEIEGTICQVIQPDPEAWPAVKIILRIGNGDFEQFRELQLKKNERCEAKEGDRVAVRFWLNGRLGTGRYEGRVFNTDTVADIRVLSESQQTDDQGAPF